MICADAARKMEISCQLSRRPSTKSKFIKCSSKSLQFKFQKMMVRENDSFRLTFNINSYFKATPRTSVSTVKMKSTSATISA